MDDIEIRHVLPPELGNPIRRFRKIDRISQLLRMNDLDLLGIPGIGPKRLKMIEELLLKNGWRLGMLR